MLFNANNSSLNKYSLQKCIKMFPKISKQFSDVKKMTLLNSRIYIKKYIYGGFKIKKTCFWMS